MFGTHWCPLLDKLVQTPKSDLSDFFLSELQLLSRTCADADSFLTHQLSGCSDLSFLICGCNRI